MPALYEDKLLPMRSGGCRWAPEPRSQRTPDQACCLLSCLRLRPARELSPAHPAASTVQHAAGPPCDGKALDRPPLTSGASEGRRGRPGEGRGGVGERQERARASEPPPRGG